MRPVRVDIHPAEASVVVASKDRPALLLDLLSSLAASDPPPGEVVVVDDGSEVPIGGTIDQRTWPFRLRLLRNETSQGPAAARNRGVHACRGDPILFTDDDCVVSAAWMTSLLKALGQGEERLGGVGGPVLARDRDIFSRYFEFHQVLQPRPHDAQHPRRVPYLVTANCAVWRDAFMRAGGFDEAIRVAGGEDAALSMRMAKCGFHFEHESGAIVHHRFRPGVKALARMFYYYGLGGRYVVDRYLPL